MKASEARGLLRYTLVMWKGDPEHSGTVIDTEVHRIKVSWWDGATKWLDHMDCRNISLWNPRKEGGDVK